MKITTILFGAALAAMPALAQAEDLNFSLTNGTSAVLDQFYASPGDTKDWEEDILGKDVLAAGETTDITIADGREHCQYDMRFVFQDGSVLERADVEVCENKAFTLTE